jgi:hypothetical protein
MKIRRKIPALCAAVMLLLGTAMSVQGQGAAGSSTSASSGQTTTTTTQVSTQYTHVQPGLTYRKPTHTEKFKSYLFDGFGPYAILGAAVAGGIEQIDNSPPEWGQGAQAYGSRFGSSYGINVVTQTTRYALSELFREDPLYYRCDCSGWLPRTKHALISTVTARKGDDGHRVFSLPSLVAPYAGGEAAANLWYPSRYGPKDGFRFGNYNLLTQAGLNMALEFVYGGPHTLLSKVHVPIVSNATGSTQQPTQDKP